MKISTKLEIKITERFFNKDRTLGEIAEFGVRMLQIQQKRFNKIMRGKGNA